MLVKPFVLLFPKNLALEHGNDLHGDPLSDTNVWKGKAKLYYYFIYTYPDM